MMEFSRKNFHVSSKFMKILVLKSFMLFYYIKMKCCLSVCTFFQHARSSMFVYRSTPDLLDMKHPSLGNTEICSKLSRSPSVLLCMPGCRRFLPKLHLHSCKTAAQTQLIIYTAFLATIDECSVCCVGCASDS